MSLLNDLLGPWRRYRRWRGGLWTYMPMWGWTRYVQPKPWPNPDREDFRHSR